MVSTMVRMWPLTTRKLSRCVWDLYRMVTRWHGKYFRAWLYLAPKILVLLEITAATFYLWYDFSISIPIKSLAWWLDYAWFRFCPCSMAFVLNFFHLAIDGSRKILAAKVCWSAQSAAVHRPATPPLFEKTAEQRAIVPSFGGSWEVISRHW